MKKFAAILIAILILASVFAGCAKEEPLAAGVTAISKAKVGDKVQLGKYEQDNNTKNGKENIVWQVLAVEKGKALLLSEKVLEAKPYNDKKVDMTWEACSLRKWLNGDFLKDAFKTKERDLIIETTLPNKDNPKYGTPGGKDTKDKVFILSFAEAKKYFANAKAYKAKGTEFAKTNGLKIVTDNLYLGNSGWWLRSPGLYPYDACYVNYDGLVYNELYVNYMNFGARPTLWVKQ